MLTTAHIVNDTDKLGHRMSPYLSLKLFTWKVGNSTTKMVTKSMCLFLLLASNVTNSNLSILAKESRLRVDPEVNMNTTQLITSKGYPCEEHDVITSDGYIINIQRIPHSRSGPGNGSRPVVLLQHGLLSCSACWVENLANESLGFILADAGYDVWLGNSRGNTYGLRHTSLSPTQEDFWAFSWDEIAAYDLPAMVDKVLTITGANQLAYVGHSQGTEIAFAELSHNKTLAKKIKLFIALAPAAFLGKMLSPITLLKDVTAEKIYDIFGKKAFLPSSHIITLFGEDFCRMTTEKFVCENVMFLLGGYDFKNFNASRLPVYIGQHPAGTSVQNMIHYLQAVNTDKFQKFDFGPNINMKKYNQTSPPQYDLSAITTPTALFSGTNDWLAVPEDVNKTVAQLRSMVSHKIIPGWEHLDFIWAMNAPEACYNDVLNLLKIY